MSYLTTRESLIGHSGWALPQYTEIGHSSSSFWGTASPGRDSNPRSPVPMALNISEGYRCVLVSQIICSVSNYCGVTIEHSECPKLFYCTFSVQNNEHDHRHSPTSKNNPRPLADDWGECGFVAVRQQSHGLRRLNYVPFYAVSRCITRQQVSDKCFWQWHSLSAVNTGKINKQTLF